MGIESIDPRAKILVKGAELPMEDLIYVSVHDKIEENDEFEFTVYNRDRKYKGAFEKAQGIEIHFGYGSKLKKLLVGSTDEVTYSGGMQGETVNVKGTSAGLAQKVQTPTSKTWENTNLKEIMDKIARQLGWKATDLTNVLKLHEVKVDQEQQLNETPLVFIHRIFRQYGLEIQVKDGKLIVRDPADEISAPVDTFEWGKNIISYQITEKSKDVHKEVTGTDYDPVTKSTTKETIPGKTAWTEKIDNALSIFVPSKDPKDCKQKTEAKVKQLNREEKTINLVVIGQNKYRAGSTVKTKNIEHPGTWYAKTVTHSYSSGQGYQCTIEGSNKK